MWAEYIDKCTQEKLCKGGRGGLCRLGEYYRRPKVRVAECPSVLQCNEGIRGRKGAPGRAL